MESVLGRMGYANPPVQGEVAGLIGQFGIVHPLVRFATGIEIGVLF